VALLRASNVLGLQLTRLPVQAATRKVGGPRLAEAYHGVPQSPDDTKSNWRASQADHRGSQLSRPVVRRRQRGLNGPRAPAPAPQAPPPGRPRRPPAGQGGQGARAPGLAPARAEAEAEAAAAGPARPPGPPGPPGPRPAPRAPSPHGREPAVSVVQVVHVLDAARAATLVVLDEGAQAAHERLHRHLRERVRAKRWERKGHPPERVAAAGAGAGPIALPKGAGRTTGVLEGGCGGPPRHGIQPGIQPCLTGIQPRSLRGRWAHISIGLAQRHSVEVSHVAGLTQGRRLRARGAARCPGGIARLTGRGGFAQARCKSGILEYRARGGFARTRCGSGILKRRVNTLVVLLGRALGDGLPDEALKLLSEVDCMGMGTQSQSVRPWSVRRGLPPCMCS
jgi:hypothetical protein